MGPLGFGEEGQIIGRLGITFFGPGRKREYYFMVAWMSLFASLVSGIRDGNHAR